jgi:hypothetical protein
MQFAIGFKSLEIRDNKIKNVHIIDFVKIFLVPSSSRVHLRTVASTAAPSRHSPVCPTTGEAMAHQLPMSSSSMGALASRGGRIVFGKKRQMPTSIPDNII